MRKFLGFVSILGFIATFAVFVFSGPALQFAFIAGTFLFTLFIISFYGLTLLDDDEQGIGGYPSLSVIIPSYNSEKTVGGCIEHVLAMEYPHKVEVVLVDDGSTDRTREIASKYPIRIIHRKQNRGKAASLNEAISQVKGELVACIDSDTYPPKNLLIKSVPHMERKAGRMGQLGAMTYFITVHNPKTIWQKMQEMEYLFSFGAFVYLAARFNSVIVTPGPLTVFRREALVKIGGFAEDNITEDFEMALKLHKAGYGIGYQPISVPTEVPASLSGLMRQRVRWYRGTIYNIFLYKEFMLNPKYADVGTFAFPVIAAYVPITVFSFFFVLARAARFVFDSTVSAAQFVSYGHSPDLSLDLLYIRPELLLFLSFLASYLFFLTLSMSLIRERITLRRAVGMVMVIFVYPFVNSGFYALSLYKEIAGSKLQW
jgi:biofilm PGA synthesis N-glycosyltransferase PgaC